MFTIEELKKDLEAYNDEQARLREHFSNLTGAIRLLQMQIQKLKEINNDEADDQSSEGTS